MKKILPICIIGVLILSGFGAGALNAEKENVNNDTNIVNSSERATHTVLGEYGTATWCGYCRYAHGALKELYAEGQLDFYYITYVCDMNPTGYSYCISHYNLYGYPTLWWDGGRRVDVGAGSVPGAKSTYTSSINYLGSQSVKDVDIDLTVTWLGGTEMQVDCTVTNNEANTYGGTIQVAICEKESSRGWIDTGGVTYTMTFLDWAFNEPLSISSGGSWSDSMTWDGSAHGYSSITEDNIMVIATAFNDEWHQGYSYPPSSNPFDAYYVDETVAATPGGGSGTPNKPNPPSGPTSGVIDVEYTYTGSTTDPDGDDIYYLFDWGDGTDSGWLGPYPSGTPVEASHAWTYANTFGVRLKAKDTMDGPWSDPLSVEITGLRIEIGSIDGGLLKVGTVIQNDGDIEFTDVNWKITLAGGAFIGKETAGEGLTVPANGEATISSGFIFGFGPTEITVEAWIEDGPSDMRQQDGFVLLFFVKVNPGGGI